MWYIIIIVALWAAALISMRKQIAQQLRLYFRVLRAGDPVSEKAAVLFIMIPMYLVYFLYSVFILPIPSAAVSLFRKIFRKELRDS